MLHTRGIRRRLGIAAALLLLGCQNIETVKTAEQSSGLPLHWENGNFMQLPLRGSGDLVLFVDTLTHDPSYVPLTPEREVQIGAMFDAIQTAITTMMGGDLFADWCTPVAAAGNAGYLLGRYYDSVSKRWYILGQDGSATGHAYFFINPEPVRDLIVEAPHVYATNTKLEGRTDTEGARILRDTMGRALLINGADRCRGLVNNCGGTFTSDTVCPGFVDGDSYRQSDSGHNTDTAFHVLHQRFNNVSANTRFVQLHGNSDAGLASGGLSVSDGRSAWAGGSGLASAFVNAIQTIGMGALPASSVNDCTNESNILCGYRNIQGRYTNSSAASCNGGTMSVGGTRFLHLEQKTGSPSLIDAPQPVIDALRAIFPCAGCSLVLQEQSFNVPACPEIL